VADLLNRYRFVKEAEQAYKAYVARAPERAERVLVVARFLALHGRATEAFTILSRAWSTCPPEQVAGAALALYDARSVTETQRLQMEVWVAEALQKRPDDEALAIGLGAIRIRQGRFDEAEALYRRVVASTPDNVEALNNLAWLLAMRDEGKTGEALELIKRAIENQGANPSLVDTRAVVLIRAGRFEPALQDLEYARAIDPKNPSVALHLAWVYGRMGRLDEARKAFQEAEALGYRPEAFDPLERTMVTKLRQELGLAGG
jgi:Flp pilus assembly protein TadD